MTSNVIKPTAIGSIGAVLTGRTPPASNPELFGDVYPFITPTDMDGVSRHADTERFLSELGAEEFRRILLPAGAVCVVCIGATIGKVCMTSRPSFTNQQINAIVVDRTRHDPVFVFHALRQLRSELQAKAGGAATPIINKSTFSGVDLLLPPRPIQEAAGKILSAYDDLIANCERRIKVLDEMVRSLYREWFVEFRCPGHEGNGALPSDWRKTTADAVAVETRRNVPKGDVDAAARYVGLEHIPRRSLALDSWKKSGNSGPTSCDSKRGKSSSERSGPTSTRWRSHRSPVCAQPILSSSRPEHPRFTPSWLASYRATSLSRTPARPRTGRRCRVETGTS